MCSYQALENKDSRTGTRRRSAGRIPNQLTTYFTIDPLYVAGTRWMERIYGRLMSSGEILQAVDDTEPNEGIGSLSRSYVLFFGRLSRLLAQHLECKILYTWIKSRYTKSYKQSILSS